MKTLIMRCIVNVTTYIGRFAPSPSGPLHLGSVIAAAASYLDARAHNGRWLIRIEDIDPPREVAGAATQILRTLDDLRMSADQPVIWQSERVNAYQQALDQLRNQGDTYPCVCSRKDIARVIAKQQNIDAIASDQLGNLLYPGTCRPARGDSSGQQMKDMNAPVSWRLAVNNAQVQWADRPAGFDEGKTQTEALAQTLGDFVIRRRDHLWSYQLAVVIDDAYSGITDIVRGVDLADSNARQIHLRQRLGLSEIRTLHFPVLVDADGKKVAKQNGAPPVNTDVSETQRVHLLNQALGFLSLRAVNVSTLQAFWPVAIDQWRQSAWMQT